MRRTKEPIKLAKFTVLVGPNNSAKTTLLLVLFMFASPDPVPLMEVSKVSFLEKYLSRDPASLIYLYSGKGRARCTLMSGRDLYLLEVSKAGVTVSSASELDPRISTLLENAESALTLKESTAALIPHSRRFEEDLMKMLVDKWEDVQATGAHVDLVKSLVEKGVVSDRFTEVTLHRDYLVLRKEVERRGVYVKLSDQGDGVRRFVVAGLWLEAFKPKVVLWDDLEASAHPFFVKEVLEWLAERDWQVVASTHSIDVLHELTVVRPEDALVVSLYKDSSDVLVAKPYTLDEVDELFEKGLDVRKLLAGGRS